MLQQSPQRVVLSSQFLFHIFDTLVGHFYGHFYGHFCWKYIYIYFRTIFQNFDMDVETGSDHKKENSNFMKFKKFISRIKLVAKKLNHIPIIFLCILFLSSIFKYTLTTIKCVLLTITIQIVIFLYTLFFRKQNKKYL